ncbi:RNA-processing protein HAT helix [Penicillium brevicompactum]|uniref:U4/U6 snRNA-associated-splicing factor PRP24 n=1 Tax=Penicillium brevicompactum TaxID=5074 RepID=A0A9W9RBZ0_PENBR|nr:RNA-processing protein HAT helix [Penicillium brevicompactum]
MDINSLLSPDSNPKSRNSTPVPTPTSNAPATSGPSPHKALQRTRSGGSRRKEKTSSPLAQQIYAPAGEPSAGPGGNGTSPTEGPSRQPATPGMDTLADLASMQHHQPQRPTQAQMLRGTESYEHQLSPSTIHPHVNSVNHNTPTSRRDPAQRTYAATSLEPEAQQMATELFRRISLNPHTHDAHVQFIGLLHAGFRNHVYPPNKPDVHGDPRRYDLLNDLKTAREEMDKLFAMGEDLWAEWIQDESMLAQDVDGRIAVLELCQRSVEEEYGSTKLWHIYGEWVLYLYNSAHGETGIQWTEEDRMVGREVFTWESVLEVWQRAADATKWRINNSHLVWDRLLDLYAQDIARGPSQEKINHLRGLYEVRLQTPHATWGETFQKFSGFISTYCNSNYEDVMAETVARAAEAKALYAAREEFEHRLAKAEGSGDRTLEWTVYSEYIQWELTRNRRKRGDFSFDLVNAIYQRAVLQFPTDVSLWEDYIMFLIGESLHRRASTTTISTLDRATRHCPWSGNLWSQYLLSSERESQSFNKISNIKHKATSTGLLDAGGLEEVLKVHVTWCSYLRRRAFLSDSTDEDIDVAEVGIRSAIESVQELGEKKYGPAYQGDPLFRLERIYIRFLSESGSWDSARETFKGLVSRRGGSYEFWLAHYGWELICWSKFVQGEATVDAARRTPNPSYATAVLKQAIKRTDLDWPEKIVQTYITHCEDYEDSDELQLALIETRKAMRAVNARREAEAREATEAQQQQQQQQWEATMEAAPSPEKRKREDEKDAMPEPKKARNEEAPPAAAAPAAGPSRDRENATVMVKKLPKGTTEHAVRQFFRHSGTINRVTMLQRDEKQTEEAIIEFETKDEALAAQTRDQKQFEGNVIDVAIGAEMTLWITNLPPTADEKYFRELFGKYGEVVDVRFPSLKYDKDRRFCYVSFSTPGAALHATELNGMRYEKDQRLHVKISNPAQKTERSGPRYEGREIYLVNIDWSVDETNLREAFSRFGEIEKVNLPRKIDNTSKGYGFITFTTKEDANNALAMNDEMIKSRRVRVEIATPGGHKRVTATTINRVAPRGQSAEANGTTELEVPVGEVADRTLALMNIPDTVNEARVRAVVEPFGRLVRINLRPDHQGALVEFVDVHDAGKAMMALEGKEIAPDRPLHLGTVEEMKQQRAEWKSSRVTSVKQTENPKKKLALQPTAAIKRPQQPSRKGGLGAKRHTPAHGQKPADQMDTTADGEKPKKSNDDFRAMLKK